MGSEIDESLIAVAYRVPEIHMAVVYSLLYLK